MNPIQKRKLYKKDLLAIVIGVLIGVLIGEIAFKVLTKNI